MSLKLYNSLTRNIEPFAPVAEGEATMYACGPTVYSTAHIGNFRTFTLADLLFRSLTKEGYTTKLVMNVTDVGHLVSDADEGEDKMAKGAAREGLTMWELAAKYTKEFLDDSKSLNLTPPDILPRATAHIHEQIEIIKQLERGGFTYLTSDGVYFDTALMHSYGELSDLDEIQEGARVEKNPEKRNPSDFVLWKFHKGEGKREMEWESPWGVGFPGWHIECSAMSLKYLGNGFENNVFTPANVRTIDLHVGGIEHKQIHHPNEIAQSESATGQQFVKYWVHGAHLMIDEQKISKSVDNVVNVSDIVEKNINPLALRYFYFSAHYRKSLNFTWQALEGAHHALLRLYAFMAKDSLPTDVSQEWEERFMTAIRDDLNLPEAVAVMWEMLKSPLADGEKVATLFSMDEILGLGMRDVWTDSRNIPGEIHSLLQEREKHRAAKDYTQADAIRTQLDAQGYILNDTYEGTILLKKR